MMKGWEESTAACHAAGRSPRLQSSSSWSQNQALARRAAATSSAGPAAVAGVLPLPLPLPLPLLRRGADGPLLMFILFFD